MSQFLRVTPKTPGARSTLLLNMHHIERIDTYDDEGSVLVLKGPHGYECLEVAEEAETIEAAMHTPAAAGLLQLHECVKGRPDDAVILRLHDLRSVSPRGSGSLVHFGRDGAASLEAYEDLETIASMIEATALLSDWRKDQPQLDDKTANLIFALTASQLRLKAQPNLPAVHELALMLQEEADEGKRILPPNVQQFL